jgi:hypothetical protein
MEMPLRSKSRANEAFLLKRFGAKSALDKFASLEVDILTILERLAVD